MLGPFPSSPLFLFTLSRRCSSIKFLPPYAKIPLAWAFLKNLWILLDELLGFFISHISSTPAANISLVQPYRAASGYNRNSIKNLCKCKAPMKKCSCLKEGLRCSKCYPENMKDLNKKTVAYEKDSSFFSGRCVLVALF